MTLVETRPAAADSPLAANEGVLVVQGADRPGLVRAISTTLADAGANIVSLDQYTDDPDGGHFFQRTVFHLDDFAAVRPDLEATIEARLGQELGLTWHIADRSVPKRVAILASTSDHCLLDLLWRHRRGEIPMTIPMVESTSVPLMIEFLLASFSASQYFSISFCWPPKATTVLMEASTSSAMAPARPYVSISPLEALLMIMPMTPPMRAITGTMAVSTREICQL